MYLALGWVTGTGGGISIKHGEHIYLAPSGVQKERIKPEHIFVLPFAQSSMPKPGSQRDFLRIPTRAVNFSMSSYRLDQELMISGIERIRLHSPILERLHPP